MLRSGEEFCAFFSVFIFLFFQFAGLRLFSWLLYTYPGTYLENKGNQKGIFQEKSDAFLCFEWF